MRGLSKNGGAGRFWFSVIPPISTVISTLCRPLETPPSPTIAFVRLRHPIERLQIRCAPQRFNELLHAVSTVCGANNSAGSEQWKRIPPSSGDLAR